MNLSQDVDVKLQPLSDLTAADPRSVRFTSRGLSLDGSLPPEAAARHLQAAISSCDLVPAVPEATRQSFERIRLLHTHGLFLYDAFTVAFDLCALTTELALRERFLAMHSDAPISLRHAKSAEVVPLPGGNWTEIDRSLQRGVHRRGPWVLEVSEKDVPFTGNVKGLVAWARAAGLLPGIRSRSLDSFLHSERIRAGHMSFHLRTPVDSARAIHDLAELINQLWGVATPGGRLFPGPVEREVVIVAWPTSGDSSRTILSPDQVADWDEASAHQGIAVLAVKVDPGLWSFDSWYERTNFPAEVLCGPSSLSDLLVELDGIAIPAKEVSHLERLFAVRFDDARVDQPLRPHIAVSLTGAAASGRWMVARADFPSDAFVHAMHLQAPTDCEDCVAEEIFVGDHAQMVTALSGVVRGPSDLPPRVAVPPS